MVFEVVNIPLKGDVAIGSDNFRILISRLAGTNVFAKRDERPNSREWGLKR